MWLPWRQYQRFPGSGLFSCCMYILEAIAIGSTYRRSRTSRTFLARARSVKDFCNTRCASATRATGNSSILGRDGFRCAVRLIIGPYSEETHSYPLPQNPAIIFGWVFERSRRVQKLPVPLTEGEKQDR